MSVYLDASVLVSLFSNDVHSEEADRALRKRNAAPLVSDFGAAEFASVISRKVRMHALTPREASSIFTHFDAWLGHAATRVEVSPMDFHTAETALRRLDLPLRAPDAVHIGIALRLGTPLATFDRKMAESARMLHVEVF